MWGLGDQEGTIRDVVNASGVVQDHRQYDSFGQITSQTNSAVDFVFAYAGRPLDAASGLYDNRARWYDPRVGRFASEDPSGFAGRDMNLYRYALNNPLTNTDPTGLQREYAGVAGGASSSVSVRPGLGLLAGDPFPGYSTNLPGYEYGTQPVAVAQQHPQTQAWDNVVSWISGIASAATAVDDAVKTALYNSDPSIASLASSAYNTVSGYASRAYAGLTTAAGEWRLQQDRSSLQAEIASYPATNPAFVDGSVNIGGVSFHPTGNVRWETGAPLVELQEAGGATTWMPREKYVQESGVQAGIQVTPLSVVGVLVASPAVKPAVTASADTRQFDDLDSIGERFMAYADLINRVTQVLAIAPSLLTPLKPLASPGAYLRSTTSADTASAASRNVARLGLSPRAQLAASKAEQFLGTDLVVKRADSKSFVAVNSEGTRRFRMDLQGHGDLPHGHIEVFDAARERWVDAGSEHRYYFRGQQ